MKLGAIALAAAAIAGLAAPAVAARGIQYTT